MFVAIGNTPRDYAWGSTSAIAEFRGVEPSGSPEAELWLGAHEGSPARVHDAASVGHDDLAAWIANDPERALGPGLAAQRLTTAEPDDTQVEVAVAAMRELVAPSEAGAGREPELADLAPRVVDQTTLGVEHHHRSTLAQGRPHG